jgi:hypothetical protein
MSRRGRLGRVAVVLLVATLVAVLAPGALLASAQGSGPADAISGAQGWTQIAVGQRIWYAFDYSGDKTQILIRMPASPRSALAFSVWTPAAVDTWARTGKEYPVGRGSPDPGLGNDLAWSGNFNTRGTYYVRVEQKGTAPGSFDLRISGKGVTFASAAQTAAVVASPAAEPAAQLASVVVATKTGSGPGDALSVTPAWTTASVGQRTWYAFLYSGDKSQITIRVPASPRSAVAFSVWTPAQADAWNRGLKQDPVGRGSPNAALGNDLVWSGNFSTRGTYYVLVEQKGSAPGSYSLQVTGKGVTF